MSWIRIPGPWNSDSKSVYFLILNCKKKKKTVRLRNKIFFKRHKPITREIVNILVSISTKILVSGTQSFCPLTLDTHVQKPLFTPGMFSHVIEILFDNTTAAW
jgi:hypothetical protein